MARFLSEDSRWLTGDSENLYRFGFDAPTSFADPNGEHPWLVAAGAGFLAGAAIDVALQLYSNGGDISEIDVGDALVSGGIGAAFSTLGPTGALLGRGGQRALPHGYNKSEGLINKYLDFGWGRKGNYDALRKGHGKDKVFPLDDAFKFPSGANPLKDGALFGALGEGLEEAIEGIGSAFGDGRSDGDPHLSTFDGVGYSFQAVGEFTLAIGDGFEIQTRQSAINDSVSVNSATVMNIGDNVVGIYADQDVPLVINGTPVILEQDESIAVGDGSVYRGNFGRGDELGNFDVYVVSDGQGNGFWTNVYFDANHLRPFVNTDDVAGLLGNLNGDRSDDFQLRDGTVLSQPLAETLLYGEFADSWRITQEDSLFVYGEGESTETFTDRNFPNNIIRLDDLDPDARAAAEAVAIANGLTPGTFEFETTVLDMVLTGSEDFAVGVGGAPEFQNEGEEVEIVEVEINEAPTTAEDTASVDEDGSVDIDVLANDTDPEGDMLTLVGGTDPNGGTVSVVDGELRFSPAANFNGETTLSYDVTDAGGNTVTGNVVVTVTAQPDAPIANDDNGQGFTTDKNTALTTDSVLLNDSDADGDTLRITGISLAGTLGLVTDNGDGTFDYDPNGAFDSLGNGETATDRFSYTVSDGNGGVSVATVTVTITDFNEPLVQPLSVEAEDMVLDGYQTYSHPSASNDSYVGLSNTPGSSGSISYVFVGGSGNYDIDVAIYDENDGQAVFNVFVNEGLVGTYTADKDLGTGGIGKRNLTGFQLQGVAVNNGDTVRIEGVAEGAEFARIDKIDFSPSTLAPTPTSETLSVEAEDMVLDGYETFTHPSASNDSYVSLSNTPGSSGSVSYGFEGDSGTYDIEVAIYDEDDGQAAFHVYVNEGLVGTYTADEDFGTGGIGKRNLTSFLLQGIAINNGDTVRIEGAADGSEFARIDKIDFTPTSAAPLSVEAEDMVLDGYQTYSHPSASDGSYVSLANTPGSSGSISYVFEGGSGIYDMEVGIYDEDDGQAVFNVYVNNDLVGTYTADEDSGSGGIGKRNLTSFQLQGVAINNGDTVRIEGTADGTEFARIDKIDFTPTSAAPLSVEAEDMVLDGYQAYSHPSASDGSYVSLANTPGSSGSISYEFEGGNGIYDIEVAIYDENDGQAVFNVYVNDSFIGFYTADEDLGTGGIGKSNLTSFQLKGLAIKNGDTVRIEGAADGTEFARIDKIDFTPSTLAPTLTPAPTSQATTNVLEAEDPIETGLLVNYRPSVAFGDEFASLLNAGPEEFLLATILRSGVFPPVEQLQLETSTTSISSLDNVESVRFEVGQHSPPLTPDDDFLA